MYSPNRNPGRALEDWVFAELLRVSQELQVLTTPQIILSVQNAEPAKPRDGMVAHADGTNWNPGGTGKGLYVYSTSAWVKL